MNRLDSTYAVFDYIKEHGIPSQLWKKKRLTENQVKYALGVLKAHGFVKKITKGVWETCVDEIPKRYVENKGRRTQGVTMKHTPNFLKSDMVRLHGARILVRLPKYLKGWGNREKILDKLGIEYTDIVQGQRIAFEDIEKIWLCDRSIYIYFSTTDKEKAKKPPFSWYGDDADSAEVKATDYILGFIGRLERHLHAQFAYGGKYRFRFTNRHYSLIKNAIAQKYHEDSEKLFVFDDSGLWLLIDNSFNLLELETVHPETAHDDNKIIHGCLNDMKRGVTPSFLMERINEVTENQHMFNKNFETHVSAIKELTEGVKDFRDAVNEKKQKKARLSYDKGSMITW